MNEEESRQVMAERLAANEKKWERKRAIIEAEAVPIVADLRTAGFNVNNDPNELARKTGYAPKEAIPILMKHFLRGGYDDLLTARFSGMLNVSESYPYWDELVQLYQNPRTEVEEDRAAQVLSVTARKCDAAQMKMFLLDNSRGDVRIHFVRTLLRIGGPEGEAVVDSLQDDPVVGKEATTLLHEKRRRRAAKERRRAE